MSYSFNNLTLSGGLDSTGTLNIGTSTATAINFGKAGVTTTFPGPISTSQPATFDDIDTTGQSTMLIGKSKATKLEISKTGVTTEIKGNLNTSNIDSTGTLKLGSSTASKVELGRSGFATEVKGSLSVPNPSGDGEAANKAYVDSVAAGLDVKPSCDVKTTTNLTSTYSNGKLTANSNGALTVDGILTTTSFTILVANQTNASENGIYKVTQVGSSSKPFILTRTTYADTPAKCTKGLFTHILRGTVSAGHGYVLTNDIITMGTTAWVFSQMSSTSSVDPKNVGTNNIFKDKSGNIINFRGIKSNNTLITATQATNDVELTMNQGNITGTGGLTSGSIESGFGTIVVKNLGINPSPASGKIYYNSGSNEIRFYNGSTWTAIGAGGSVGSSSNQTNMNIKQDGVNTNVYTVYANKVNFNVTLSFPKMEIDNVANNSNPIQTQLLDENNLYPSGAFIENVIINNEPAYARFKQNGPKWYIEFVKLPSSNWTSGTNTIQPFSISYKAVNSSSINDGTWGTIYPDFTPPSNPTLAPANGDINVSSTANITMTFGENIVANSQGPKDVIIKEVGGAEIDSFTISDPKVSINNNVVSISSTNKVNDKQYTVIIKPNCLRDMFNNDFGGIAENNWKFNTVDTLAPTANFTPLDNSIDIPMLTNLSITFSENVTKGTTGNITIIKTSSSSTVETIPIGSTKITVNGVNVNININQLDHSTPYHINIGGTCFKDASGNFYSGISDTTTWNFVTVARLPGIRSFLDTVSVSPSAALGVSRLLSSYSSNCMKVRRSSDNALQDIGFDKDMLDELAFNAFVGTGKGYLHTWYDQSGNGNHFEQTSNHNQPEVTFTNNYPDIIYINSGSKNTFAYNPSGRRLHSIKGSNAMSSMGLLNNATVYTKFKTTETVQNPQYIYSAGSFFHEIEHNTLGHLRSYHSSNSSVLDTVYKFTDGKYHTTETHIVSSTSNRITVDSGKSTSLTIMTNFNATFLDSGMIIGDRSNMAFPFNGSINNFISFSTALSYQDRSAVSNGLNGVEYTSSSSSSNTINLARNASDMRFNTYWSSGPTYSSTVPSNPLGGSIDSFDPGTGPINGAWIKIKFSESKARTTYRLTTPFNDNSHPWTWQLFGRTGGGNYTHLSNGDGGNSPANGYKWTNWSPSNYKSFTISGSYDEYVLHILKNGGGNIVNISTFEVF